MSVVTAHRAANIGTPETPWVLVMHLPEPSNYMTLRRHTPRPSQRLLEQLCQMIVAFMLQLQQWRYA